MLARDGREEEPVAMLRLGNNEQSCTFLFMTSGFLMECLLLTLGRLKKLRWLCMDPFTYHSFCF